MLTFDKDRLPRDSWLIKGQIAVGAKPIFKYSSLGLYHYVNFRKVLKNIVKDSEGRPQEFSGFLLFPSHMGCVVRRKGLQMVTNFKRARPKQHLPVPTYDRMTQCFFFIFNFS